MTTNHQHQSIITQLKQELTKNTGEVLQKLRQIFQNTSSKQDELILHANKYERLLGDRRKDLISYAEFNLEIAKLNNSLLEFINTITEAEAKAYELENAIFQRILVICLNKERKAQMQTLFPEQYYKDISYQVGKNQLSKEVIDQYQLVIFDDMETDGDYFSLYEKYLQTTTPYLLYFGKKRVPDTNSQGELKAYFTNSIFSIHARLQEMFTFLKYKQDKQ